MSRTPSPTLFILVLLVLGACGGASGRSGEGAAPHSIAVAAAASLTDVVTEAAAQWGEAHSVAVRVSCAASSTIARQLEVGAPHDVVLLADEQWMDHLVDAGSVDALSRRSLAFGSLVVVVAKSSQPGPGPVLEIDGDELPAGWGAARWTTADPTHVPLGRYAAASLCSMGWWDRVEDRLVPAPTARAALRLVERGEVDWGVVYRTDAAASAGVRIVMAIASAHHAPVVYSAAVSGEASGDARAFLEWLASDDGRALFMRHGFAVPAVGPLTGDWDR